jgi:uncharacterized membrane protein YphA (DoxX/SURF4 family)
LRCTRRVATLRLCADDGGVLATIAARMLNVATTPLLASALALALGALFAIAGARKLRDPRAAIAHFEAYAMLPAGSGRMLALPLAATEVLAGAGCVLPATRAPCALALALLLALYTVAVALNLHRGNTDIDCGCAMPGGEPPLGAGLLARNVALLLAALACVVLPARLPATSLEWIVMLLLALLTFAAISAVNLWLARDRWLRDD